MLQNFVRHFANQDELKNHLNELKTKFCKLESDLHISRNVNDKLLIVLEVLDTIDATVSTDLVKDCPGIPSKGSPKKVILKLSRRKDSRRVLLNKKKLKQLKPESLNLPASVKIYINESLCPYYKKLWTKCKKLWDAKRILSFWVSNGSIRVKLVNENVSIITHDCDLEKLFPGDPLIADTN